MSEFHSQGHLNEFTETGVQQIAPSPRVSVSLSVENFLVSVPASVKHSIKPPTAMYRTRSPQKGKQEATEGSLDHALQAIREQLTLLASERRAMETRAEALTRATRAVSVQIATSLSSRALTRSSVQRPVLTEELGAAATKTMTAEDEVDYAPKEAAVDDAHATSQDRISFSSAGSSQENLLARNSPDVSRVNGNASPNFSYAPTTPQEKAGPLSYVTGARITAGETTPQLRHTTLNTNTAQTTTPTPSRPNSVALESSFDVHSSQLSINGQGDEDERSMRYSSSLVLNDKISNSAFFRSEGPTRQALSDPKRAGGNSTIIRRSSETGQLEHFRRPVRYTSFSNTAKVAPVTQMRCNASSSPHHEGAKLLKSSRKSVILPGIETTV